MTTQPRSDCCNATVTVDGDDTEGTHYYVCTNCNNPCDRAGTNTTSAEIVQVVDNQPDTLETLARDFTRIDRPVSKSEVRARIEAYTDRAIAEFCKNFLHTTQLKALIAAGGDNLSPPADV